MTVRTVFRYHSFSCPLRFQMIHCIPQPKSTVNGVRWWNHQEWVNSTQEFTRHLKRTCSLCGERSTHRINRSCSSRKLKQETGFVWVVDSTPPPTLSCRLQTSQLSHHLMALYVSRTFLRPFIWRKNYSLPGVEQEVVCVADACLFGFHVCMATGTYLPCAVRAEVHTVHTMCHYCILHTFLLSEEQRV